MTPAVTPSERAKELRARVLAEARANPSPSRQDVARRGAGSVVIAVSVMLAMFFVVGGPHATTRAHWLVLVTGLAWGAIAFVATRLAVGRGPMMLGASRSALLGVAVLVAPLLAVTWFMQPSPVVTQAIAHGYRIDAVCFAVTMALAFAPFVAFLVLRKEGDPVKPGVTGAAIGAAAGAWGAMLIDLHCELTDPRHVLVGHVLPVVVFAALGALVGRSSLAVRPSSQP